MYIPTGIEDPLGELGDREDTVFRDVMLLTLSGFVAIVILLLPHIHPRGAAEARPDNLPGNVIVELFWDRSRNVDLDLWVQAPNDVPVGYSNQGSLFFNLLRDDLGRYKDKTPINYEVAFSRGIAAGEHIVNVHFYRFDSPTFGPVPAKIVVTVVDPKTERRRQVLETELTLVEEGQEKTAVRFAITELGALLPESVHNTQRSIRGIWPK